MLKNNYLDVLCSLFFGFILVLNRLNKYIVYKQLKTKMIAHSIDRIEEITHFIEGIEKKVHYLISKISEFILISKH